MGAWEPYLPTRLISPVTYTDRKLTDCRLK